MKKITVGQKIAKRRKEKGLTQKELAEMLHLTNKDVSRWESCDWYPNYEVLGKLCEILDVSLDDLFDTK